MSEVMSFVGCKAAWQGDIGTGKQFCPVIPITINNPHPLKRTYWDRRNESPSGDSELFHARLTSPLIVNVDVSTDATGRPAKNFWQYNYAATTKYMALGDTGWGNNGPWGSRGMAVTFFPSIGWTVENYSFFYDQPTERGTVIFSRCYSFRQAGNNIEYTKDSYSMLLNPGVREAYWPDHYRKGPSLTLSQLESLAPLSSPINCVEPIGDRKYTVLANAVYTQGLADFTFKYDEYSTYLWMQEDRVWKDHRFESGCSAAYMNAVDQIPVSTCNTIANILDVINGMRSITEGYKAVRGASNLIKEAWLGYRYAYNTTKMDIEAYSSLASRLLSLTSEDIKCYGSYRDDRGRYTCAVTFSVKEALPRNLFDKVKAYTGLDMSASKAWDLIPYSFVVDWFLHIGDILTDLETWNKGLTLHPQNLWFTMSTSYSTPQGPQDVFIRVRGSVPPKAMCFRMKEAGSRTIFVRVLDACALFIG